MRQALEKVQASLTPTNNPITPSPEKEEANGRTYHYGQDTYGNGYEEAQKFIERAREAEARGGLYYRRFLESEYEAEFSDPLHEEVTDVTAFKRIGYAMQVRGLLEAGGKLPKNIQERAAFQERREKEEIQVKARSTMMAKATKENQKKAQKAGKGKTSGKVSRPRKDSAAHWLQTTLLENAKAKLSDKEIGKQLMAKYPGEYMYKGSPLVGWMRARMLRMATDAGGSLGGRLPYTVKELKAKLRKYDADGNDVTEKREAPTKAKKASKPVKAAPAKKAKAKAKAKPSPKAKAPNPANPSKKIKRQQVLATTLEERPN